MHDQLWLGFGTFFRAAVRACGNPDVVRIGLQPKKQNAKKGVDGWRDPLCERMNGMVLYCVYPRRLGREERR